MRRSRTPRGPRAPRSPVYLGADPGEIALMRSTTEGLNVALMGLEWRRGDEVITTQLEHICLFSVLGLLVPPPRRDRRRRSTSATATAMWSPRSRPRSSPRTRAIAISHVQWSTGAIMPAGRNRAPLPSHEGYSPSSTPPRRSGRSPIDVAALGVDAYAMAGPKVAVWSRWHRRPLRPPRQDGRDPAHLPAGGRVRQFRLRRPARRRRPLRNGRDLQPRSFAP